MLCQHQIRPWQRLFFLFAHAQKWPNSGVIAAGIQVIPTLSLTLTKLVPLRLTCQQGIASPSGHPPAPRPPEVDTAGASPYDAKPSCWHTMAWHLPQRASSDGPSAVLAPTADSRAYKSARLLRCSVGPQMRPIDALLGGLLVPPQVGGSPPDPHWGSSLYFAPFVANVNYQLAQLITTFRSGFPRCFFRY